VGSSYLNASASPKRWGNAHPNIVPYEVYRGGDDKYFVIGVGTEALWKRFRKVPGVSDDLGRDERFQTNALRIQNREILVPLLQNVFRQNRAEAWLERLAEAGIPAAPINTVSEAVNDAQTRARGLIVQMEHPAIGTAKSIANPMRFSNTPVSYRLPPPLLGEHTGKVLVSLGYTAEQVQSMAAESAT
jgi:crotonobetainyl-CoA:carnitine CoA-transferase CaiB-like acyl-CoA transferase